MTEEEAKTKWCPMTRHIQFQECIVDSRGAYFERGKQCRCIASDCMMWADTGVAVEGKRRGYCGLVNNHR